jgi:predicted unusual protein kinase regulating ubiquinone biosynthesis (AarF/ABC1/UbiB family)
MSDNPPPEVQLDFGRYLRVVRFFGGAVGHFILWEIVLRHTVGRRVVERSAARRWRRIAQRFRSLAIDLGGVLIKLGQFLSIRVDVLPQEVTAELAGLQDEVPAVPLTGVRAVVEAEFGRPVEKVFSWFAPEPVAAASLAQVHHARLLTGENVVVKVQRPDIERIVETDLRAVQTAAGWLKRYGPIRRRVDLDLLFDEFGRTTRAELDFVAEGQNAEHFAEDFRGDECIRIPHIYSEASTRRVLVMEDVANIKIGDLDAIEIAGVSRKAVARHLFDAYLQQIFVHNFVHADPHPGNLFVQPLEPVPGRPCPFRLVFVDFGMVAVVPERVRKHLRDYLIGFATRDAGRMVRAFQGAGVLLPGVDLVRLEQVEAELLDRYWGLTMGQAQQVLMSEWHSLAREYRDILYEMPFQLPTDLLFVGRAMAILFGMATSLDPEFDPWQAIAPFAQEMAVGEAQRDWRQWLQELVRTAQVVYSLPGQADRFFSQATRGELEVRSTWSRDAMRSVHRVESAVNRLAAAVVFAALLLAGIAMRVVEGGGAFSYVLLALAAVALVVMVLRR